MSTVLQGVVHGNIIELKNSLGVADGQTVEVVVRVVGSPRPWGEGIRNTAGALADDPYWDTIMSDVQQERRIERRPQMEEA